MRGFLSNSYRGIFKVCVFWHHAESQPALHQNQTRPMLLHWEQVQPSLLRTKPSLQSKSSAKSLPNTKGSTACLTSCSAEPEALHRLNTQLCHRLEEHRAATDPAQPTCTFYLYSWRCQQPFPTCAPANAGHQSRP